MTLLDILEGIGPHNAEREELERRQSSGSEGDNERSSRQHHEDAEENNFAGTAGTTGEGWLAGASSLAEETMASPRTSFTKYLATLYLHGDSVSAPMKAGAKLLLGVIFS